MSKIKDTFFGGAEKKAGQLAEASARESLAFQKENIEFERGEARRREGVRRRDVGEGIRDLRPFESQGPGLSLQKQQAFSGALGPEAQAEAFQGFEESPGTQFAREQGLRLIDSKAGATGGVGGGNRLRELTKFSQGLALQDLENQFNRLGVTSAGEQGVVGRQQEAATNIANLRLANSSPGANTGGLVSGAAQSIQDIGTAQGAIKTGSAAGLRAGVGQVARGAVGGATGGLTGALEGGFGI